MASKTTRSQDASSDDTRSDAVDSGAAAASVVQRQLATAADWMSGMFRAGERLQQAQLHMVQRAALLHSQAADNLRKANGPVDLMTIQATLVLYECQEGMRFLQEWMLESAKVGRQVADRLQEARPGADDGGAGTGVEAPILNAWQQVFNGAMQATGTPPPH